MARINKDQLDTSLFSTASTIPIANGGTGSTTQNFVDLTTTQTVAGNKTFTGAVTLASLRLPVFATTTTATLITTTSTIVTGDATSAAYTITLPATTTAGLLFIIKKIDSTTNAITVSGTVIDGAASYVLSSQYDEVWVVSTTTSGTWRILQNYTTRMLQSNSTISTRINPRVNTLTVSTNTYTPNGDTTDEAKILSPTANFTLANPTGTPVDRQKLTITCKSGTTAYTITYGTLYQASGVTTLPSSGVVSKTITLGFVYDSDAVKWILRAVDATGY